MYQTAGTGHGMTAPPSGPVFECEVCSRLIQEEAITLDDGETLVCSQACRERHAIETADWRNPREREEVLALIVERGDDYRVDLEIQDGDPLVGVTVADVDTVNRLVFYGPPVGKVYVEKTVALDALLDVHVNRARRLSA